jgi:hypothetical protein
MGTRYPVCAECGSFEVIKDAWAEWDHESQKWVLSTTFDTEFCVDCDGETNIEWIKGDPKEEEEEGDA